MWVMEPNNFYNMGFAMNSLSSQPRLNAFNNAAPSHHMHHDKLGLRGSASVSALSKSFQQQVQLEAGKNEHNLGPQGDDNVGEGVSAFSDGGTTYFYAGDMGSMANGVDGEESNVLLPNFSSHVGTVPQVAALRAKAATPAVMAESDNKLELVKKQYATLAEADPRSQGSLPSEVDNFASLCPLEASSSKSSLLGYETSVYKATSMKTGGTVCLRRVHNFRLSHTKCMIMVEQWRKLAHANLVSLRHVFTTKAFGDHSIVFVYDYFPCAETLAQKHFNADSHAASALFDPFGGGDVARPYSQQKNQLLRHAAHVSQHNAMLPESLVWSYVIQLTSALRHVHANGLASRTLDASKIIVSNRARLRLNCCGIIDTLAFDPNAASQSNAHYQQEDLIALGKIVLALACNSFLALEREHVQTSLELVASTYSADLRNLIVYLLTNTNRVKNVNDLMPMIGARFYTQLESSYASQDVLESELSEELESSRLLRVLSKLCTVVEREELNGDYGWAECGDRYMLKLFRDYVFHQVTEDARPWLDMAHVVSCLNKIDAGVHDKICLMSRDEQNVLVVSYAELKQCLQQSFEECLHAFKTPTQTALKYNY